MKIALFGDSIAAGLGVRDLRYASLAAQELGAELVDYAVTGSTVAESLRRYRESPTEPDVAIVAHGVTEPIFRPRNEWLRFMPARWRPRGWMDPRPYFSRRTCKRLLERLESAARWRVKNVLLRIGGGEQLMGLEAYKSSVEALVDELRHVGATVILLEPTAIDERFFPRSRDAQKRYWVEVRDLGDLYIDTCHALKEWEDYFDDRFHPNGDGHRKIADLIVQKVDRGRTAPSDAPERDNAGA